MDKDESFWKTLPGIITAVAGLIAAVATLLQIPVIRDSIGPTKQTDQVKTHGDAPRANPGNQNRVRPVFLGEVTDPIGDSRGPSQVPVSPDLAFARVEVKEDGVRLVARLAPGTLNPHTTHVSFLLDTDQNPLTGSPGADAAGSDRGLIGVDYLVGMGSDCLKGQATILRFLVMNRFQTVGSVPVTFSGDEIEATIPLGMLGNPDGPMNFKVNATSEIHPCGYTGVLDYMPDLGLPPGRTTAQ